MYTKSHWRSNKHYSQRIILNNKELKQVHQLISSEQTEQQSDKYIQSINELDDKELWNYTINLCSTLTPFTKDVISNNNCKEKIDIIPDILTNDEWSSTIEIQLE